MEATHVAGMLEYLDVLEAKYGKLPGILATRAEYVTDLDLRCSLLEEACALAVKTDDDLNVTLIAEQLVEFYVEEKKNATAAAKWLAVLADAIGSKWSDSEHQEFLRLESEVERLKRAGC